MDCFQVFKFRFQFKHVPLQRGPNIEADGNVALAFNDETRARGKLTVALSGDEVRRCRLTASKPALKAHMVSALEATI
jgi:hypothetical protein